MKPKFNGILTLLLVFIMQLTFAQTKTVTGTVSDNSGPLPGAVIIIKGTKQGTETNFDGQYSIKVKSGDVLQFSYIGMISIEKTVASSNVIDVVLEEDSEVLQEVVVTALGIKRNKASIGSSVAVISAKDLTSGAQNNIADALKGKVAGVTISSSSTDPGASSGIIIRGFSSLGGGNQPLFVIDGVPVNNTSTFSDDLDGAYDFGRDSGDINPDDIESMTILKGASSTALYGSRAANGVILITTKKGKNGKLSVNVSSTAVFTDVLRVPRYQNQFGQGWDGQHYLDENGSWGPKFDDRVLVWGHVVDNAQKIKPYSFQKDQLRNFFDIGTSYINNIAISGGKGDTTARLSYSNTTSDGIYPTKADTNERNNMSLSFTSKIEDVTFGGTLNYIKTNGTNVVGGQGTSVYNNLLQIPTDIDITEFKDYTNDKFNNVSNYYTPYGVTNPYFTLDKNGAEFLKNRVYGSFNLKKAINDWSALTYTVGIDQASSKTKIWTAIIAADPGSPNAGSSTEQTGSYFEQDRDRFQINHDLLYSLDFKLNEDFNLSSSFGFNYNERTSTSLSASVSSQSVPDFYSLSNTSDDAVVSSGTSKRRLYGILNTSTLSYKDMLFINANIRNDWYSTLPSKNRSVLYGGINASWIMTETIPELKKIMSYGKLRIEYGETGVDTGAYQSTAVNLFGSVDNQGFRNLNFPAGGLNAVEVGNRAANPDLRPERRKEFEVGYELSFLNNRINLDFSYYDADVQDQILSLPLSSSSGFTSQTANVGSISNKGYEALLDIAVFRQNDGFNWNTIFNYATNNSTVTELDSRINEVNLGGLSTVSLLARKGQPLLLLEGSVPLRDPSGNIVVDNNGVPIASPNKEIYGDTQYDYTLGIINNFSYKNFGLGFTLDIRQGGLMFSRTASIAHFTGNSITTTINDRQPYIIPNSVVQSTDANGVITYEENVTAIDTEHWDDYYRADALDRSNVIDKSFIKLREVTFSYKLPKSLVTKWNLDALSLTVVGRNLLLFTPESNQYVDPEVSTFGTDARASFGEFGSNPTTRSLGITLKAKF